MSQRVAATLRRSQRSAVAAAAAAPATVATPTPTAAPKSTLDEPIFFASASAFEDWLAAHHATETEVFVGYYKKASGRQTVTWSETVDAALCWGWIDGHGRGGLAGGDGFAKRFTPRRGGGGGGSAASAAYRRDAADWVMAALRPATRERRLVQLIEASARGERVKHLAR